MSKLFTVFFLMVLLFYGLARAESLVDRNTLINRYGIEDSPLVDAFIEDHQITEASLAGINAQYLFEVYKKNNENDRYRFDYLFDSTENQTGKALSLDRIARVAFFENPNNEIRSVLFDVESAKIYFGNSFIYHDIRSADSLPLDSGKTLILGDALEKANVWAPAYLPAEPSVDAKNDDLVIVDTGWISWALTIEFTDGSLRQFSGNGQSADHFPEDYAAVSDRLFAILP